MTRLNDPNSISKPGIADNKSTSRSSAESKKFTGTILLIDDDEVGGQTLEMMLKTLGCEIIRVENGIDALSVANSMPLDLIITDMCLPHMTGMEIIEHVRTISQTTPIFVITGFVESLLKERSEELRINEIFLKPIPMKILIEKVSRYLRPAQSATL